MRSFVKILSLILLATLVISVLPPITATAKDELQAEIEMVYGGAKGIVSMTFDDGYYPTALVIEELCEKYGLEASLMMVANHMNASSAEQATPEVWNELFSKGYLEPQNHSMTHMDLRDIGSDSADNLTEENFKDQIIDSGDKLEKCFPEYDIICYAIPYGVMCDDALRIASSRYYMVRSTASGKQSLDPGFEFGIYGSWSKIYSPTTVPSGDTDQLTYLMSWVDTAAAGYWYCPITHRMGDGKQSEIPYDIADAWFKYIKEVRDKGYIWVTTASKATKYLRERQNSTASAKFENGILSVRVDMADSTADGMPLDNEIFDHPLSVKVELPAGYRRISYQSGGECRIAESFFEDGKLYALIDVVPNTGDIALKNVDANTPVHNLTRVAENIGDCKTEGTVAYNHCTVCDNNYDDSGKRLDSIVGIIGPHSFEDVPAKAATCTESGIIAHKYCRICQRNYNDQGTLVSNIVIRTKKHSLIDVEKKDPTCFRDGNIWHQCCTECNAYFDEDGNELSSVSIEKRAHALSSISKLKSITDASGAVATSYCSSCKSYLDAAGNPLDGETLKSGLSATAIAIIVASAIVVAMVVGIIAIRTAKKKKSNN